MPPVGCPKGGPGSSGARCGRRGGTLSAPSARQRRLVERRDAAGTGDDGVVAYLGFGEEVRLDRDAGAGRVAARIRARPDDRVVLDLAFGVIEADDPDAVRAEHV